MTTTGAIERFTERHVAKAIGSQDQGSIWEYCIIELGPSLNGKFYSRETLQDAVKRGIFNDLKASEYFFGGQLDHVPEDQQRVVPGGFSKNIVGWFENIRYGDFVDSKGKNGEGVLGTLHILDSAKKLKSDLLELFEAGKPELLGISIDARGLLQRASLGGRPIANVMKINKVNEGTIVNKPAAGGRAIRLVASISDGSLQEAVLPFRDLPLADRAMVWDSDEAKRRVRAWATDGDEVDTDRYSRAFVIVDGPRENLTSYKLPIATIVDGSLRAVPRGIFAAAGVLRGARGGIDASAEDKAGARRHLSRYFDKMDLESPFSETAKIPELIETIKNFGVAWTEGVAGQKPDESALEHLSRILQINLARAEYELSRTNPTDEPDAFAEVSRGVEALTESVGLVADGRFSEILDLCSRWANAYHLREQRPQEVRRVYSWPREPTMTTAGTAAKPTYEDLEAKLKEAEGENARLAFEQQLKRSIDGSELPDAAKERLFKLLSGKVGMTEPEMNEAIKAEAEYLKVVAPAPAAAPAPAPTVEAQHTRPLNPDGSCPTGFTKRGDTCVLTSSMQAAVTPEGTVVEGQAGQAVAVVPDSGGKPIGLGSSYGGGTPNVQVTQEAHDKIVKGFEGFFQEGRPVDGVPAFNSLHRAFWQITGHYYPEEMLANFLMEAISKALPPREFDDFDTHIAKMRNLGTKIYGEPLREAISTADFTTAFGDALNKRLQAEYRDDPLSDWREIVSRRENLRDLTNNHRIVRIGGYGTLPIVAQKAPYQELSDPTEAVEQLVPKKRGGLAILTWEDMLADSIGVVASIPRRLGRAANRTVHEVVWDEIENNPVLDADSVALVAAAHNNRLSGDGAISADNVATLIEALINQTEQDSGRKLGLSAWRILTGPTLFQEAWEIANSDVKASGSEELTIANFIKGLGVTAMKTIGLGRTAGTQNRWYVVANPRDAECIVVGFLGGRDRPEIFVQSPTATPTVGASFDADQLTFKIRFGVAAKVVDFRWIQGSLTA
jgi:hypothetical protein